VYRNEEVLETIRKYIDNEVTPLSRHLKASRLAEGHPLITAAGEIGLEVITSPTSSDQGLIDVPSVKIGPGKSERSHTSDEYIRLSEIREGIVTFIQLLQSLEL
jgi:acetylornithine deacetylase